MQITSQLKKLTGYDAQKERSRDRQMKLSESGRDIGEMPEVVDPERKERARTDFQFFCEQYHPETFPLKWSDDHIVVIKKIEMCAIAGGTVGIAMPRGSGKSSLSEIACEWATFYGHQEFVALIGSDQDSAIEMLDSIKSEIENNEHLLADFPEICFPVHALEGINQRAKGQLYEGELTRIAWKGDKIVLPTIKSSLASAAVIRVAGITGRIRGMKFTRPDGRQARPTMVIIDDPQTNESSRSPSQCKVRSNIIQKDILGMTGPGGKKITVVMPMTVIEKGDLADKFLDRNLHPDWQGIRMKLLYEFPKNTKLWDEYAKIRVVSLGKHGDIREATAFYAKNRKAMDEGAKVAWEERYEDDEISAIQFAMNLFIKDPVSFWSEYQNEPMDEDSSDGDLLTADEISRKLNGIDRYIVPAGCSILTTHIDVHAKALYYKVIAWESNFTGYIIDYGAYPKQSMPHFTLKQIKNSLKMAHRGKGLEGAIYAGLEALTEKILGREYKKFGKNAGVMRVDGCLIDANWSESTDVVYQFCRQSKYASILTPAHGKGYTASMTPMNEIKRKRGDRVGNCWKTSTGHRQIKHVVFDTNFWKSFVHSRLNVGLGDVGCLSLFGNDPRVHEMMADHLVAEKPVETKAKGRSVDEWKAIPNRDNHLFDNLVGSAVCASMNGAALPSMQSFKGGAKKKKIKLSEIKRRRIG